MGFDIVSRYRGVKEKLQRVIVCLLDSHFIPGNRAFRSLKVVIGRFRDGDVVAGKLGCAVVDEKRIQTHLERINHVVNGDGLTSLPLRIFTQLDVPYLSFLVHLLRLRLSKLRHILEGRGVSRRVIAVEKERGHAEDVGAGAGRVDVRIDRINIRRQVVAEHAACGFYALRRFGFPA